MTSSGVVAGALVLAAAAGALIACSSPPSDEPAAVVSAATVAGSEDETATSAGSVIDVDVCAWIASELRDPVLMFGVDAITWDLSPRKVYRGATGSVAVSCDFHSYDAGEVAPYEELGRVTLMAGATPIEESRVDGRELSGLGVPGVATTAGGVSLAAAQLEPGVVLSIRSEGTDIIVSELIGETAVVPLLRHLVGAWQQGMVPRVPEDSFGDVIAFCHDLELHDWTDVVVVPEGEELFEIAHGSGVGGTRDASGGIRYEGAVNCGYSAGVPPTSFWPWDIPETFGRSSVVLEVEQYADAGSALGVVERHEDGDACVDFRRIGEDTTGCPLGAGSLSTEDAGGNWIAWLIVDGSRLVGSDGAAELQTRSDDTLTRVLARLDGLRIDPARVAVDPRLPVPSMSEVPPDQAGCAAGEVAVSFVRTPRAHLTECLDDTGRVHTGGVVDGIAVELEETGCGTIDATRWGGDEDGSVCRQGQVLVVTSGQGPTTHLREYVTDLWLNPDHVYYE